MTLSIISEDWHVSPFLSDIIAHDADIHLLDDPFSAVDAHTTAILFNE